MSTEWSGSMGMGIDDGLRHTHWWWFTCKGGVLCTVKVLSGTLPPLFLSRTYSEKARRTPVGWCHSDLTGLLDWARIIWLGLEHTRRRTERFRWDGVTIIIPIPPNIPISPTMITHPIHRRCHWHWQPSTHILVPLLQPPRHTDG